MKMTEKDDIAVLIDYLEHFKYFDKERVKRLRKYLKGVSVTDLEDCPNCGFTGGPITIKAGACPDGCAYYSDWEKKLGVNYCVVCGSKIEWL